jgi:hypothetical protein
MIVVSIPPITVSFNHLLIDKHRLEDNSSIGFLLSAKNLFTITDIVFGKLHHRLLVLKITSQENFTFKFIPVHDLYNSLGAEMANILPVAHSLTGCDTTSSFFDIGQKTVYKILKQNNRLEDNSSIGFLLGAKNLFTITDIVFGKLHHRLLVLKTTSQENFTSVA